MDAPQAPQADSGHAPELPPGQAPLRGAVLQIVLVLVVPGLRALARAVRSLR